MNTKQEVARCEVMVTAYNLGDKEVHTRPCGLKLKEGKCPMHD